MTMPDAVVCSDSSTVTTMRSSSGLMLTLVAVLTTCLPQRSGVGGLMEELRLPPAVAGVRGARSSIPERLALWRAECQFTLRPSAPSIGGRVGLLAGDREVGRRGRRTLEVAHDNRVGA